MAIGMLAERIPKIHLHCHLEGSLRAPTFIELAHKHNVPLRYRPGRTDVGTAFTDKAAEPDGVEHPYRFNDFEEFLLLFAAVNRSLKDPEDYARLAREFVEDALAQNVIYGELFVSPSVWTFFNPALDVRATMEAIVAELRRAQPLASFKLLPDLTRNFGSESALDTAKAVAAMTDLDVIGISLGGDEVRFPAPLFVDAFDYARAQGLHRVAHAGEAGGPQSVRDAVELLRTERIGHGVRSLEDAATVELLASRGIPLEICPTSNRLTGVALPGHPHPHVTLDGHGCIVTVDGDDPAIFRTSIQEEYALVEAVAGAVALERYVRNAIGASFADPPAKQAMEARLAAAVAELEVRSRS
ncbi:MAG: adenosine deaminase [Candidatus Eremiobacteraeota bacterium]|nr:adenosine deaminase [Candidatus Eremiobacteraeota bacterium]